MVKYDEDAEAWVKVKKETADSDTVERRVMSAQVKDIERHYHILFKDGGMYLQRKNVVGATDNPLSFQEIIIIELCEAILEKQA